MTILLPVKPNTIAPAEIARLAALGVIVVQHKRPQEVVVPDIVPPACHMEDAIAQLLQRVTDRLGSDYSVTARFDVECRPVGPGTKPPINADDVGRDLQHADPGPGQTSMSFSPSGPQDMWVLICGPGTLQASTSLSIAPVETRSVVGMPRWLAYLVKQGSTLSFTGLVPGLTKIQRCKVLPADFP